MRPSALALLLLAVATGRADAQQAGGLVVVSNMRDNTATLVDAATGVPRATLPTGFGPHEVAASSDGRWAVVTNYGDRATLGNSLTLIDLTTATVARTIDLGQYRRPHGAKFLPGDTLLVVTSEASQSVLLVDPRTGAVAGTIPTDRPLSHMLAVSADGRVLFTSNVGDGSISHLDLPGRTNLGVIPIAHLVEGIAITPDGRRVWVGSNRDSIVVVVDVDRGQPVDTLRGFGLPYRIAITADGGTAVITDPPRGEVRIVDTGSRRTRQVVTFQGSGESGASPEGVTTSPDGRLGFVTLEATGQIAAIDLKTAKVLWTAPVGTGPDGIAYAPPVRP
jgi:DNA-binding beta-propeller fold protein YncE